MKKALKNIVSREYWRHTNHPKSAKDSVFCLLDCGHTVRFKGSQEPKAKARCFICSNGFIKTNHLKK